MGTNSWKGALIIQSLFLFSIVNAQSIHIDKPVQGQPLSDSQEFEVSISDATATRVDFYLNGRLIKARKKRPYRFKTTWNTHFANQVRFEALLETGKTIVVERSYSEIKVDVETSLQAFQFFPFLERPGTILKMTQDKKPIIPQVFEQAGDKIKLKLVIVLDVSGSMKFFLDELSPGIHDLVNSGTHLGWEIRFLLFDLTPRQLALEALPEKLETLYAGRAKSVVWDTLATASELFPQEARRVILLVSDGRDDGSLHSAESATAYIRKSQASLLWMNPTRLQNFQLARLTELSGGFGIYSSAKEPWSGIKYLLKHQYHLVAPGVNYPIKLTAGSGRVFYPKWE